MAGTLLTEPVLSPQQYLSQGGRESCKQQQMFLQNPTYQAPQHHQLRSQRTLHNAGGGSWQSVMSLSQSDLSPHVSIHLSRDVPVRASAKGRDPERRKLSHSRKGLEEALWIRYFCLRLAWGGLGPRSGLAQPDQPAQEATLQGRASVPGRVHVPSEVVRVDPSPQERGKWLGQVRALS